MRYIYIFRVEKPSFQRKYIIATANIVNDLCITIVNENRKP